MIMREASATNEAGDRAIPPTRVKAAELSKAVWNLVLKPYFIGTGDEPLDGPQPQSPFADLVVDGITEAVEFEAEQQVKLTRRVLRTSAPDLAAFLIDGEELRDDSLLELTAGPGFDTSDYRDPTTGKIDPDAARRAFVRPKGTYDPFHRFVDPGGYRLSDRIWRSGLGERRAIDRFMEYHISRGTSAVEMARTLEVFLTKPAGKVVTPKPYGTSGSYSARRLARTEITAAAGRATIAMSEANPMVGGVRWILSRSHREIDECDFNARGGPNGDGVYAPSDVPRYPNHPHELCTLSPQAANNIDDVVKSIRKRVRRARNEFTNSITGGTAASPEVKRLKRLLSPKELARAALSGTLDQTIADISRKFVRPGVPLASAPTTRPKAVKSVESDTKIRIRLLQEKLVDLDEQIIIQKSLGNRKKVLSLQSSKSRFKKQLREAQGTIVVTPRAPTPTPVPKPEPAPKRAPGAPTPAVVTPIPTGTDAEQLAVVRQNITNMKREKFLLSRELTGATHKRAGEIRTRAAALTAAIKRQEGYVTNIVARTPTVAPTPTPEPTPKAADPQVTKLQGKMADLYAKLDIAKASGDKKKIASVQSSLSVTRRKLRALGAEPIAPGQKPIVEPTPTPAPRVTLPPPKPIAKPPKPIPEPKHIITKAVITKQRAGGGAKERAGVYRANISQLQQEMGDIDRRLFQGPARTEETRLIKRRATVEKLLIKQAAGLAKAEARLAKSPSARGSAGRPQLRRPGGPEVTLTPIKATSKLNKVDDHRTTGLTDEARELHDETWKQARRLKDVHKVPTDMTTMDVYAKNTFGSGSSAQGQYHPVQNQATLNSNQLEANNRLDKGAVNLTTWHEIGHGMDYQWLGASSKAKGWGTDVMGRANVSSKVVAARDKLMKTLMDSSRVIDLIDSKSTGEFRGLTAPSAKYMGYATSEVEVFARGYSQYAAEVLQDAPALKYCKKRSTSRSWGFGHWTADEFAPLKVAFDEFFEAAGMLPE